MPGLSVTAAPTRPSAARPRRRPGTYGPGRTRSRSRRPRRPASGHRPAGRGLASCARAAGPARGHRGPVRVAVGQGRRLVRRGTDQVPSWCAGLVRWRRAGQVRWRRDRGGQGRYRLPAAAVPARRRQASVDHPSRLDGPHRGRSIPGRLALGRPVPGCPVPGCPVPGCPVPGCPGPARPGPRPGSRRAAWCAGLRLRPASAQPWCPGPASGWRAGRCPRSPRPGWTLHPRPAR